MSISTRIVMSTAATTKVVAVVTRQSGVAGAVANAIQQQVCNYSTIKKQDNWSNQISFTSPESDFSSLTTATSSSTRSMSMSSSSTVSNSTSTTRTTNEWSNQISFTSPESDFTGVRSMATSATHVSSNNTLSEWANQLSFASPESDFTGSNTRTMATTTSVQQQQHHQEEAQWTNQLSFVSPESDFVAQLVPDSVLLGDRSVLRKTSITNNDSIVTTLVSTLFGESVTAITTNEVRLPKTFKEALLMYNKEAIVITTAVAPYNIVYVNKAWEDMCGYTSNEVLDKTLSCIQGPKTNTELAQTTVQTLVNDVQKQVVDMYLINYRKNGTNFINHITMGTMTLTDEETKQSPSKVDDNKHEFLVGILQEVASANQVPLRMI